jgi:hypothetical protein
VDDVSKLRAVEDLGDEGDGQYAEHVGKQQHGQKEAQGQGPARRETNPPQGTQPEEKQRAGPQAAEAAAGSVDLDYASLKEDVGRYLAGWHAEQGELSRHELGGKRPQAGAQELALEKRYQQQP